jgi:hypothetical protein
VLGDRAFGFMDDRFKNGVQISSYGFVFYAEGSNTEIAQRPVTFIVILLLFQMRRAIHLQGHSR